MKERPILFSAPMVRSLLNGSKTQTRRVVKPEGAHHLFQFRGTTAAAGADEPTGDWAWCGSSHIVDKHIRCPYGKPGDMLWVRETWAHGIHALDAMRDDDGPFVYAATDSVQHRLGEKWKPSIHMPRLASRIKLEITGVRAERLQDISEADAMAEGIERLKYGGLTTYRNYTLTDDEAETSPMLESQIESYRSLWDSINAANRPKLPSNPNSKRYASVKKWLESHPDTTSWNANPWVWVIELKQVKP